MATNFILEIDDCDGESQNRDHKDKGIDVYGFNWGVNNNSTIHDGGGGGAGKCNFHPMSFTKRQDSASTKLMLKCAEGAHIPKATMFCYKQAGNDTQELYYKITFEDLLINNVSLAGTGSETSLDEQCSFEAAKIKVEYKQQDATGKMTPKGELGWDCKENKKY